MAAGPLNSLTVRALSRSERWLSTVGSRPLAVVPCRPGTTAVRRLDDAPLTELVMNNLETTQRAVHRILGGVLSLPEDDRTTLLATARAWLEASGSAAEAGRALYRHQNTVRYRMHRLEEFLRGPLDNPEIVAELSMAIDAVGTFPTLLEHPHVLRPA
ncbi:helix-turn-helix domain-containing protein [Streptomyces sp. NPDC059409]|uniref:PucR family transcriptional regulator n=1 Tax=Streptomyces sp. NPDC059409 TaxID=3346824 RepID=UPI00369AA72F